MPFETSIRVSNRFIVKFIALAVFASATLAVADEPSRLGRLFRFGSGSRSATANPSAPAPAIVGSTEQPSSTPSPFPIDENSPTVLEPIGPTAPPVSARIQPSRAVPGRAITASDPLITRIALGRSTDGRQFGMFVQVFEDGTVIDSEGVHTLGPEAVRPIVETIKSGEVFRVRGHCGNASTDFIENVQMIVYDRRFGTLRAHSFSFSGNGQGCDHTVKHLQVLLDGLQAKISEPNRQVPEKESIQPRQEAPQPPAVPQPSLPTIIGPS